MIDFEGGVAGGFYHPYLGMKYLPELVDQMERIPDSEWLDLKKTQQTVKTDKVEIHTSGDGTIQVKNGVSAIDEFFDHHRQTPLEKGIMDSLRCRALICHHVCQLYVLLESHIEKTNF